MSFLIAFILAVVAGVALVAVGVPHGFAIGAGLLVLIGVPRIFK